MTYHTGDTAPDLTGTLTAGGAPKDTAGATLEVHIRRPDGTVLERLATPGAPSTTGTWSMPIQAGDLPAPGVYAVEVEVTYASGRIQTFGPSSFRVAPEIG